MALSEFNNISLSITDYNAVPVPSGGGWSVGYVDYDQSEYQFEHFDDYGNIWPKYEDISYIGRQFYSNYFVPSGQVDTTDNDKDGLYDIYELTGMRIANGQVIYTKTNTDAAEEENETLGYDTDGDGLSDGEEIIRQDTERGYFILKTNPNAYDCDRDGYKDSDDPRPMITDVNVWKLGNQKTDVSVHYNFDYVNITSNTGITGNFGGNQSWFSNLKESEYRERLIADGGCGVISASDIIIWNILKTDNTEFGIYSGIVRNIANDYIKPWDWSKFPSEKVVDLISDNTDTWGVHQFEYMNGLKKCFENYLDTEINTQYIYVNNPSHDQVWNSSYAFELATENSKKEILESIQKMLNNNDPVPMMIGYSLSNSGVNFYSAQNLPFLDYVEEPYIDAHWINIVGLIEDKVENRIKLVISTWGQRRVIYFDEFFDNHGYSGGIVYYERAKD